VAYQHPQTWGWFSVIVDSIGDTKANVQAETAMFEPSWTTKFPEF
jgi:hypothetical protein